MFSKSINGPIILIILVMSATVPVMNCDGDGTGWDHSPRQGNWSETFLRDNGTVDLNNTSSIPDRNVSGVMPLPSQYDNTSILCVIVSPPGWTDACWNFADWKSTRGIPTAVLNLSVIEQTTPGRDLAERLRTGLVRFRENNTDLRWLILAGDASRIPVREMHVGPGQGFLDHVENVSSDYYYAGLDGSWDDDGDGLFGEPDEVDWGAELYTGRLPAKKLSELEIMFDRIRSYSEEPPKGDWSRSMLLVGGLMDRPNKLDDPQTPVDEGYNDYKDNAYEICQKVRASLPERFLNRTTELYDYPEIMGGLYEQGTDNLNKLTFLEAINQGPSLAFLASHGDTRKTSDADGLIHYNGDGNKSLDTAWEYYFDYTTREDVSNGVRLPFMYISACSVGNFEEWDRSSLANFLLAPNGGAIGMVAASVETFRGEFEYNESSYGNWYLGKSFWDILLTRNATPGETLYSQKMDYVSHIYETDNPYQEHDSLLIYRINLFAYNLLGDPSMNVWTDVPGEMDLVLGQPAYVNENVLHLEMYDNATGLPVSDGTFIIETGGRMIYAVTDVNGTARMDVEFISPGDIHVRAIAPNHLDANMTVQVLLDSDLSVGPASLSVSNLIPVIGENVTLTVTVNNTGGLPVDVPTISIYHGNPTLAGDSYPIAEQLSLPSLQPGDRASLSVNWTMTAGDHKIYVMVDPSGELVETNETNNLAFIKIRENRPPVWMGGGYITVREDERHSSILDLKLYTLDDTVDGRLEYSILDFNPDEVNASLSEDALLSIAPPPDWYGTVNLTFTISDGHYSIIRNLAVVVEPTPDAPVVVFPLEVQVREGAVYNGTVEVYDPDGNGTFRFSDDTSLFDIDPISGSIRFSPQKGDAGIHPVNLSVSDGELEGTLLVHFEIIHINTPPVWPQSLSTDHTFQVGKRAFLAINATDPEGDSITYSDNTDLFDVDRFGRISFTPKEEDIGKFSVDIWASDGEDESILKLNITIEDTKNGGETSAGPWLIMGAVAVILLVVAFMAVHFVRIKEDRTTQEVIEHLEKEEEDIDEPIGPISDGDEDGKGHERDHDPKDREDGPVQSDEPGDGDDDGSDEEDGTLDGERRIDQGDGEIKSSKKRPKVSRKRSSKTRKRRSKKSR